MLDELKQESYEANRLLPKYGLIHLTFGNASALDRGRGILAIKPSGVDYGALTWRDMVLVDLSGVVVEDDLRPSSDTPTHLRLYQAFDGIGGVVHTHSTCATAFAQAGRPLECYGTTHADYFNGAVPLTRKLTQAEVAGDYEVETGNVIAERFRELDPAEFPGVLAQGHGPFTWGATAKKAAENALALELVARMALHSLALNPALEPVDHYLLDKHFNRKHGSGAYYGQSGKSEG